MRPPSRLSVTDVAHLGKHGDLGLHEHRVVHLEQRAALGQVGQVIGQGEELAEQPPREQAEHDEQTEHEAGPDQQPGPPGDDLDRLDHRYRSAPAAAHSATTARASGGATTVATPGMLAISRLRPW